MVPSCALPSPPTTVVLVGEQQASRDRGADFPSSQRPLELALVSVLSGVAALVLFQLCCLKKGHFRCPASQILFLVADEMEIFRLSSGHGEGRIWSSQMFPAPLGVLSHEPTKAHASRGLLSQGPVVPRTVWHTLVHLRGSNAGSTGNWCCASVFSPVKWGCSDTELIVFLLWRWSELLWMKFLGQSTSQYVLKASCHYFMVSSFSAPHARALTRELLASQSQDMLSAEFPVLGNMCLQSPLPWVKGPRFAELRHRLAGQPPPHSVHPNICSLLPLPQEGMMRKGRLRGWTSVQARCPLIQFTFICRFV